MSTLTLGPSVIVRPDGIDPESTSYWWGVTLSPVLQICGDRLDKEAAGFIGESIK